MDFFSIYEALVNATMDSSQRRLNIAAMIPGSE